MGVPMSNMSNLRFTSYLDLNIIKVQRLFSNVQYESPTLNADVQPLKCVSPTVLTKLRPSWPHHCYIWHRNPFAFNLDVMSNSLLICEYPFPHFSMQGSLKVQKIFSFTFPQKYQSWLYPFSEPLRPFEPLQNPQTQVTLKPSNPQTQVKTRNQKSYLERSTP